MKCSSSSSAMVVLIMVSVMAEWCDGFGNESQTIIMGSRSEVAVLPESWVSDLVYRALANFTVRNVGSTACQNQARIYDKNVRNYTSWAIRMSESWDRRPIGILAGNKYHLGIYDECVDVQSPVKGQYCLSEVKIISSDGKDYSYNRTDDLLDFGNNTWHTLFGWSSDFKDQVERNVMNLGICIPDSCSALDLQTSLQNELDNVFFPKLAKAIVKVDPIMCTVSGDMYPYNMAYYITSGFFTLLILVCCIATIQHLRIISKQENKKEVDMSSGLYLKSFSFIESIKDLLKFDKNNEWNVLNGFKVMFMLFILFGHKYMYLAGNPMSDPKFVENVYLNGPDILLTCMNLVDPFFFISGFIMNLTISPIFKKAGSVATQLITPIAYRMIRILPSYCAMMAITAHILPHLGDGPLWPQRTWHEAEKCKNYWWTNLLYINNFIDVKYQCLVVSWYVSCDIQFFAVGVVIVYVYSKSFKRGIGLLSAILGVSLSVPFILTLLENREGLVKVYIPFLENPRSSISFSESYRPSYMRATPFFIGLAFGFAVKKLKEIKFKFSKMTVYGGTSIMIVTFMWTQVYGAIFYSRQRPYYPLEHALYSTLSHCTWAILSGWVCVCYFTTGYGLLAKLFNNRLVVPLGRLSYSVFLVNLTVMMMSQSSLRVPTYFSSKTLFDAYITDTFKSYLIGVLLYLVVEAPFRNLTKMLFGRGKKKILPVTNELPSSIQKSSIVEMSKTSNDL